MQPSHWKWILCGLTATLIVSGCELFKSSYPFKGKTIGAIDKSNAISADELFGMDYQTAKKYIGKDLTITGLRPSKIWMKDTTTGHTTCEFSFSRFSDSALVRSREVSFAFISKPEDVQDMISAEEHVDLNLVTPKNFYSNNLSPCFLKSEGVFWCKSKLDSTGVDCPFDPVDLFVSGKVLFSGGDSADRILSWHFIATGIAN
ncbi:MAG: hypothetical protein IPN71_23980 [Fibrobacteres bacterium]|jgi:hypothetical protein|nr:hypothetical protein [Fibrobacterota bacterium]